MISFSAPAPVVGREGAENSIKSFSSAGCTSNFRTPLNTPCLCLELKETRSLGDSTGSSSSESLPIQSDRAGAVDAFDCGVWSGGGCEPGKSIGWFTSFGSGLSDGDLASSEGGSCSSCVVVSASSPSFSKALRCSEVVVGIAVGTVGEAGKGIFATKGETGSSPPSISPLSASSLSFTRGAGLNSLGRLLTFTLPVNSPKTGLGGNGISSALFSPGLTGSAIASGRTLTLATISPFPPLPPPVGFAVVPRADAVEAARFVDVTEADLGTGRKDGTAAFRLIFSFFTGGRAVAAVPVVLETGTGGLEVLAGTVAARCAEAAVGLVKFDDVPAVRGAAFATGALGAEEDVDTAGLVDTAAGLGAVDTDFVTADGTGGLAGLTVGSLDTVCVVAALEVPALTVEAAAVPEAEEEAVGTAAFVVGLKGFLVSALGTRGFVLLAAATGGNGAEVAVVGFSARDRGGPTGGRGGFRLLASIGTGTGAVMGTVAVEGAFDVVTGLVVWPGGAEASVDVVVGWISVGRSVDTSSGVTKGVSIGVTLVSPVSVFAIEDSGSSVGIVDSRIVSSCFATLSACTDSSLPTCTSALCGSEIVRSASSGISSSLKSPFILSSAVCPALSILGKNGESVVVPSFCVVPGLLIGLA